VQVADPDTGEQTPVASLAEVRQVVAQEPGQFGVVIDQAVTLGIGWPDIATRLGVTRQAARQHYQRRHRDDVG
jgi:hypothetical protein